MTLKVEDNMEHAKQKQKQPKTQHTSNMWFDPIP